MVVMVVLVVRTGSYLVLQAPIVITCVGVLY